MHIQANVVDAPELFRFAEQEGIADYNAIQDLIWRGDKEHNLRHRRWFCSCFFVGVDEFDEYWQDDRIDWLPEVEKMVRCYMVKHQIETLLVVTSKDAYLVTPIRTPV